MQEQVIKHLEDIDSVLCDNNVQMVNVSTHLSRIADALEALVSQGKTPIEAKPTPKKEVKTSPKKEDKPTPKKELTHTDLKDACLTSARSDAKNRDKLKALLKEYGAVKAVDVPVDKIEEVIGKIEKGDF